MRIFNAVFAKQDICERTQAPKNDFGALLEYLVIKDRTSAEITRIEKKLHIMHKNFRAVVYNGRIISQETLNKNDWKTILAKECSDRWTTDIEARFNASIASFPEAYAAHYDQRAKEPEKKDHIGYTMREILGGKNANYSNFARELDGNVNAGIISDIALGRYNPSKQWIDQHNVREALCRINKEKFEELRDEFEERYAKLYNKPKRFGVRFTNEASPERNTASIVEQKRRGKNLNLTQ